MNFTGAQERAQQDAEALQGSIVTLRAHVDAFVSYGDSAVTLAMSENSFVSNKAQLNRLLAQLAVIRSAMFTEVSNDALSRIVDLVDTESSVTSVEWRVMPVARPDLLNALLRRPFVGTTFQRWVSAAQAADYVAIRKSIKTGLAFNRTSMEMLQALKGTQRQNYRDGVLNQAHRSVASLVATATNMLMNYARLDMMKRAGVQHWALASIMDDKQSDETQQQAGQTYAMDEGPALPLHINGRSLAFPVD